MIISGEQQFFLLVSTFKGPNGFLLGVIASLLHPRQIAPRGISYLQSHLQAAAMDGGRLSKTVSCSVPCHWIISLATTCYALDCMKV